MSAVRLPPRVRIQSFYLNFAGKNVTKKLKNNGAIFAGKNVTKFKKVWTYNFLLPIPEFCRKKM